MTPVFELDSVYFAYQKAEVLQGLSLHIEGARMVAVIGPNGAGKSTLLSLLAGLRAPSRGRCLYNGQEVSRWPRRRYALEVAVVPQSLRLEFPFTAEQVVLMGRTPHCNGLFEAPEDAEAVEDAMRLTDTLDFRRRDFRALSGGERQRVVLASALAQHPRVLLLDEPTTFLDLQHQLAIYRLLRRLCEQGLLVIAVTHDLNLAMTFSSRVLVLNQGVLDADGPPEEVLRGDRIERVFRAAVEIVTGPNGQPWIHYGVEPPR